MTLAMFALREIRLSLAVVLVASQIISAQVGRTPTKECRAYCFRHTSTVQMRFSCDRNTDAEGSWFGIDARDNIVPTADCTYTYSPNTDVLIIDSTVATDNSGVDSNRCGRSDSVDGGESTYTWRLLYWELESKGIWAGLDRIYIVGCDSNTLTDTEVLATFSISHDLNRTITPTSPDVSLLVWYQDRTPNFVPLEATDTVRVGNQIQLELKVSQSSNDVVTCVSGFDCYVSGDNTFGDGNDIPILGPDGCPILIDGVRSVVAPKNGYRVVTANSTSCRARTGAIVVYQIRQRLTQYYQCRIRLCLRGVTGCEDLCAANSNPNRRRRQTGNMTEEVEKVVTVEIKIRLDNEEATHTGLSKETIIGLSVGLTVVVVILIVLGVLVWCLVRQRKRQESTKDENIRHAYQSGIPPKA